MPDYRLALAELGTTGGLGTVIEDDVLGRTGIPDAGGINWAKALSAAGSLDLPLPIDDPFVTQENFAVGARELHLYRDEDLVWGGRLWRAEVTNPKVSVRFGARGFLADLERREVDDDLVFNNTDQLDIAWALIAFTQAKTGGGLGITRGSATPSGVARWTQYCLDQRPVIADAIADLGAADDGFDFEVGADKVFRTWSPLRGQERAIVLDTATNVIGLSDVQWDASNLANEVTWVSGGGGCDTPVTETALDTDSRSRYGLMQSNITGDERPAQGAAKAEDALRISRQPLIQPTVVLDAAIADIVEQPDLADYDLGDTLTFSADLGYCSFDQLFRIIEINVLVRPMGLERVSLKLDAVVD